MRDIKPITLSACAFLVFAVLLLAIPDKAYSGIAFSLGCCIAENECVGCGELGEDCAIPQQTCLVDLGGTFFEGGSFCSEGLPGANCFDTGGTPGCCVSGPGACQDDTQINLCGGDQWIIDTDCSEIPVCSETPNINVPVLSNWGLASIAIILGIVGFMVIRRRTVSSDI